MPISNPGSEIDVTSYVYAGSDTLKNPNTKLGDLARAVSALLGTRWNSSGDLGTDIAALIAYVYASSDTLKNPNAKLGDLARAISALLGTRWDSSGDLGTDIAAVIASQGRERCQLTYWSDPQLGMTITTPAGTLTMPSVVVAGLPSGATVTRARAFSISRIILNNDSSNANYLDGATVAATSQVIQVQKGAGSWNDAITFLDQQLNIPASGREGGPVFVCSTDLTSIVTANDTYNFRFLLAKAKTASIYLQGVHTALQISYSI